MVYVFLSVFYLVGTTVLVFFWGETEGPMWWVLQGVVQVPGIIVLIHLGITNPIEAMLIAVAVVIGEFFFLWYIASTAVMTLAAIGGALLDLAEMERIKHGRRSFARRPGNVVDAANYPGELPTGFWDHFCYHWVWLVYEPPLSVRRTEPAPPPPHGDSRRYKHELKCYDEEARARIKHEYEDARARAEHGNSRAGAATAVIEAPTVATESVPPGTVFAGVYAEVWRNQDLIKAEGPDGSIFIVQNGPEFVLDETALPDRLQDAKDDGFAVVWAQLPDSPNEWAVWLVPDQGGNPWPA